MQYRKMSEDELKAYYNRYVHRYHVDMDGGEVSVRDCRSDRNMLGRSNLIFHMPMPGVLVDKQGKEYDAVAELFPLAGLASLTWEGFSNQAQVLLGSRVLGDEKKCFKSHFFVTFDAKQAQYVYIRDLNAVPDALLHQAVHYHLGNPEASAIIDRYNHYVFPLGTTYREPGRQYIIEQNKQNIKLAQYNYQHHLENRFGALPLVAEQEVPSVRDYTAQHYEDDLSCERSFVIDTSGRLLAPQSSTDKVNFIGATMVATETWQAITQDKVIVIYRSSCFSRPAEYVFEQRPQELSPEQSDRLTMVARQLQGQRLEKAKTAKMLDFLDKSADAEAWQ